ncbi:hypothetical protein BDN72DRAFT_850570, partial [Pluteus cervinus]
MGDPRLPPELEHKIFLATLQSNFNDVGNLILTAKRVHDWLLPRAFEVVILGGGRDFPVPLTLKKFKKYGPHIRSLSLARPGVSIGSHESHFLEYISHCPNITNLLIRTPYFAVKTRPLQDALTVLPLTQLIVHVRSILSIPSRPQLLQLFTNITHLQLYGYFLPSYTPDSNPPRLRPFFPNLTHLSLFYEQDYENTRLAVQGWNELRLVVLWYPTTYPEIPLRDWTKSLNFHPRLVVVRSDLHRRWE